MNEKSDMPNCRGRRSSAPTIRDEQGHSCGMAGKHTNKHEDSKTEGNGFCVYRVCYISEVIVTDKITKIVPLQIIYLKP